MNQKQIEKLITDNVEPVADDKHMTGVPGAARLIVALAHDEVQGVVSDVVKCLRMAKKIALERGAGGPTYTADDVAQAKLEVAEELARVLGALCPLHCESDKPDVSQNSYCPDCGRNHSVQRIDWPAGQYIVLTRKISMAYGILMPGTIGRIVEHTDDGRAVVRFVGDTNAHTFHHAEQCLAKVYYD